MEARLHAAVSVRVLSPQAPRAQTASVHVRLCVPVVVHSSANAQAVNAPQAVAPHEAPSVMREQARLSGVLVMLHAPPSQAYEVQVRLCVPVVPQVPTKPAHVLQVVHALAPQASPSVSRAHPAVSVRETERQASASHTRSVQVRLCIPVSSHPVPAQAP